MRKKTGPKASAHCLTDNGTPFPSGIKIHPALKTYFSYCLYKSALKLRAQTNATLAPFKIEGPHFGLLSLLASSDDQSQVELSDKIGIDKATMVKLLDQLEANKYIERRTHPEDRRAKLIGITKLGRSTFEKTAELRRQTEDEFLSVLTAEERKMIRSIIPKLLG